MADLFGTLISDTYGGLLKTVDNFTLNNTLKLITDGGGNVSPLYLSNTQMAVSGTLALTGSFDISGSVTATGTLNATASNSVSSSFAVTASKLTNYIFPTSAPASPLTGSAYFSGSYLFVYNGTAYVSASFA